MSIVDEKYEALSEEAKEIVQSEVVDDESVDDDESYYDDDSNDDEYEFEGGYQITLDEQGNFLGLFEVDDAGSLEDETEEDSEYLFVDGLLFETEVEDNGVEISLYSDEDGDGIYEKVSSEYQPLDSDEDLDFGLLGPLEVTGSDEDDLILLSDFGESVGGAGADAFVLRDLTDSVISDFNVDEGDTIVFDTGFGLTNYDDIEPFVTDFAYDVGTETLFIDFGVASLTIIGVTEFQVSWDIATVSS